MNDRQIEHFTGILQSWKRDLLEEVDRTVHHMKDDAANFPDPADRASQEEEFSLESRRSSRLSHDWTKATTVIATPAGSK